MNHGVKLISIPQAEYSDYRYKVIFKAYKWDPQVEDHNTISRQVLLLEPSVVESLEKWAEQLSRETIQLENALAQNLSLVKDLAFSPKLKNVLHRFSSYKEKQHVRLMRFDFHPTTTGWAVSEVNSDVPGGMAEASILPELAAMYFSDYKPGKNIGHSLLEAFKARLPDRGRMAFVHATSYADDRQVMEFLADYFQSGGFETVFAAPDHIRWKNKKAYSILEGNEGGIDGILRFFPLEWLPNLPRASDWKGYFDTTTVSCNHPIALLAQSKRLPLIWDRAGIDIPVWKQLLPETVDPGKIKHNDGQWIFKPALGRVGEDISIKEAVSEKELKKIYKSVSRHPKHWLAQKMFDSQPLVTENNEQYHLCIGAFTVDGKSAGFYGRISPHRRIDSKAKDIPVLIMKT